MYLFNMNMRTSVLVYRTNIDMHKNYQIISHDCKLYLIINRWQLGLRIIQ